MSEAIKTIKIKIVNPNKGKKQALESTVFILNSCLSTYIDLTLLHRSLLVLKKETVNKKTGEVRLRKWHNSEILTELEKLSLPTKAHPDTSININSLFEGLPTLHRRSCINTATGMVKSYLSNLNNWESHKRGSEFTDARSGLSATALSTPKGKPPKPPAAQNLPTFYKGTYQFQNVREEKCRIELLDIHNQFVRLKVFASLTDAKGLRFDGSKWVWKNYPVKIGRKQFSQLNDPNWSIQSPTLVPKRTKRGIEWYIHLPISKKVKVKPIIEQKKENPNLTTLAVDLGLRHLAVVTVACDACETPSTRKNREIVFVKFFRGEQVEAHRFRHLQKVFRKQQQSRKPVRGERSNKQLWRHIRDTNQDIAHQITKEMVEIAKQFDVNPVRKFGWGFRPHPNC